MCAARNVEHSDDTHPNIGNEQTMHTTDTVTSLKTWGADKPVLDAEQQAKLVDTYQTGMKARESARHGDAATQRRSRQQAADGDKAIEALVGSTWRLALRIVKQHFTDRGRRPTADQIEECTAVAMNTVVAAAGGYDTSRHGKFSAYAAGAVRYSLREHEKSPAGDSYTRVGRIARRAREEHKQQAGTEPSLKQLQQAVHAYCTAWAEQRSRTPQEAQRKLRKQGTLAAINNLAHVLATTEPTVALADLARTGWEPRAGGDSDQATIETNVAALLDKLEPHEKHAIETQYGFTETLTHTQLGEQLGISWVDARQLRRDTLQRLTSPHGRYTLTNPLLFETVEDSPATFADTVENALTVRT